MSTAEQALESAILAVLAADEPVTAILGDPLRVVDLESPKPTYPCLEIVRHQSVPAGASGVAASEHRIDLAAASRMDNGAASLAAIGAVRAALDAGELLMEGWRCVLLVPLFVDTLRETVGTWRTILRVKAVVEAV